MSQIFVGFGVYPRPEPEKMAGDKLLTDAVRILSNGKSHPPEKRGV